MKIVIFGSGNAGKFLFNEISNNSEDIEGIAFLDNFAYVDYKGKRIYRPEDFFDIYGMIDAVFIAAGAQKTLKTISI